MPYHFSSPTYSCHLETHLCAWPGGCRRRVAIGLPMCWQHSRMAYGVRVGPSTIPEAGRGLFARRAFRKGEVICPYGGQLISVDEVERRYPGDTLAPYVEQISDTEYRDAACVRGLGSMANGMARRADCNAETFVRRDRTPWLRAFKPIPEGTEIFNHYGPEYFAEGTVNTSSTRYVRQRRT